MEFFEAPPWAEYPSPHCAGWLRCESKVMVRRRCGDVWHRTSTGHEPSSHTHLQDTKHSMVFYCRRCDSPYAMLQRGILHELVSYTVLNAALIYSCAHARQSILGMLKPSISDACILHGRLFQLLIPPFIRNRIVIIEEEGLAG